MAEERKHQRQGARIWDGPLWGQVGRDLASLALLGGVAYGLLRHGAGVGPFEGAWVVVAVGGLVILAHRGWAWQRRLEGVGFLEAQARMILQGARERIAPPPGLSPSDRAVAEAFALLIEEARAAAEDRTRLQQAITHEWGELDAILRRVEDQHALELEAHARGVARAESLRRGLRSALETALHLDQVEMNHRLRSDQHRVQSQAFQAALGQIQASLDQLDDLFQELHDTFPRLRREEDALGRLADAGLRHGARLSLAMKGLVSQTPRLVEEAQARLEWVRRFRLAADIVRDQAEGLSRRVEAFRAEAQARIHAFGASRATLQGLDQVAQQTGLLAVNAAILAQHGDGGSGLAAIGARLRSLSDQTAAGASGLERSLEQHHHGLERETTSLWDLQEASERLLSATHELLRVAAHLDQQGHELERSLEGHVSLVDEVRQAVERAELSLHEAGARSMGLESALARQWGVEAKLAPERERLSRAGIRLVEVGGDLARLSQRSLDEGWDLLQRHQEIRRTEAYREILADGSGFLGPLPDDPEAVWRQASRSRILRSPRLAIEAGDRPPFGRLGASGGLSLALLGQDALGLPEPSALESWSCDEAGRVWHLQVIPALRTETHRLALLDALKRSPLLECLPGTDLRISPHGASLGLPFPYPGFPAFLAGLDLELAWDGDPAALPTRPWEGPRVAHRQHLLWIGPGGPESCMRLVHAWIREDGEHQAFLPALPYAGLRPPCRFLDEEDPAERLDASVVVRCLGLGADEAPLGAIQQRLLHAGATEGPGGAVLCAIGLGHSHPEALLLRLFQPEAGLAGAFHPDLVPYQTRLRDEVLGAATGDPYQAAWRLLEDLQREGWVMPLPSRMA